MTAIPNTELIEQSAEATVAMVPPIKAIERAEQAETVAKVMAAIRDTRKQIAEFFRPDIDAAHALHKSLLAKMKEVDAKPAAAEDACRKLLGAWADEQRRKAEAEQLRLDEEARRKAAEAARAEGDKRLAEKIEAGKVIVASTAVAVQPAQPDGVSTRYVYSAEVVDLMALVKAVAAGKATVQYIAADMAVLNSVMRATKGTAAIPGVAARRETSVVQRGAK